MSDYFNDITDIVETFESISLEEMDRVKLMNRTDTKFTFNISKLPAIFEEAKKYYYILEISDSRAMDYETKYFDTADFEMYRIHQSGKLNRYKVRRREYLISGINFLEVKFKTNKGRTVKKRIKKPKDQEHFNPESAEFLREKSPYTSSDLEVKTINRFTRYTLVHKTAAERITIDLKLSFSNETDSVSLPFLVIAEVKQEGFSMNAQFIQILKKNRIYKQGMSKYCIGTTLLNKHLKHNNFKPKLLNLNKISNDKKYYDLLLSK